MNQLIAFLCAAVAFPAMIATKKERWPAPPPPEKIAWQHDGTWFHNLKNLWTETIRADCEWWGKFLAFAICVLGVAAAIQFGVR